MDKLSANKKKKEELETLYNPSDEEIEKLEILHDKPLNEKEKDMEILK